MAAVGKISGKVTTRDFRAIVTADVKKWDYIKIIHKEAGPVLAQVTEISRETSEIYADCVLIGYRNERNFLRLPKTPLEPGAEIFSAEDALIEKSLGLTKNGLYLGLLEGKPSLKLFLDAEKILTKHIAILAKSGAGKSYAVGVLLEELADKGYPILIIDPHGEYSTIKFENKHPEDIKYFSMYGIKAKSYASKVKEYAVNTNINPEIIQLKLPIPATPAELIEAMPVKPSPSQQALLYSAFNELRDAKARFDFDDIISYVNFSESNAKWGLISGVETLYKTGLFSVQPTNISELVKPGQITIVNLRGAAPELQETAVASLSMKLFEQRKIGNLPPFFLIVEESHLFCPERGFGEAASSRVIRSIASEGRKFGLGLCVISQRPARVDKNVLSQCSSQIILQMTNPNDLKALSSFEGITGETEREITALPIGKALVIGAADHPTFADIRIRKSSHGGRAQQVSFENGDEPASDTSEKSDTEMVYCFKPRISKTDLTMLEEKQVMQSKLVLTPVICINAQKSKKQIYLVFNPKNSELLYMNDKLQSIQLPSNLVKLSPMQKKVMNAVAQTGRATVAEMVIKAGMSLGESEGVVNSLAKFGLLRVNGQEVNLTDQVNVFLHLDQLSFPERAEYIDLPAEKLEQQGNSGQIVAFLKELGVEVTNERVGYMPCWQVEFADGTKTKDALTYSLEL